MGFDPIPNRIRLVEGASKAGRMDVLFTGLCGSEVRVEVCSLTSFVPCAPWWINSTSPLLFAYRVMACFTASID